MKVLIASILLLIFINSCRVKPTSLDARITDVKPYYEASHWNLPHVTFSISIKNRSDSAAILYVNDYGRNPLPKSGSWWVYYNDEVDSLELFSASCENCYERTILKSGDSLDLTFQIYYNSMAKNISSSNSPEIVNDEIKQVFEKWNVVKYFDNEDYLFFEARRY